MEAKTNVPSKTKREDDDIDLGQLFNKTGGFIVSFFNWVGNIFLKLGNFLLYILFLIWKNAIWILAGTLIGVGIGIYFQSKNGARYSSTMTVRANFNSSRALYSTIDYFNALINSNQTDMLSKIFRISASEASSLNLFEASPVKSEKSITEMYNDQFMRQEKMTVKRMDTFWTKTIPYKDFKASLTKYDYPVHEITLISSNVTIFPKIQEGLLNEISSNKLLQDIRNAELNINKVELDILNSSIQSIDSLRSVYYKRLSSEKPTDPGNSVTLMEGGVESQAPELELYDKLIDLKNELKTLKSNAVLETDIIMVYSSFGTFGQKESFLKQNIVKWSVLGFLISISVVLLLALSRHLRDLESRFKTKRIISRQ